MNLNTLIINVRKKEEKFLNKKKIALKVKFYNGHMGRKFEGEIRTEIMRKKPQQVEAFCDFFSHFSGSKAL